ncbi:TPA: sce7726 family protein [Vibrio alginolyticus]|uniref:Sce7726 family protein n=1 Tax=Vibrio atlanticus TaxID=693153 RepID=A0ABV4KLM6_9VIBR
MSAVDRTLEPEIKSNVINYLIKRWALSSQDLIINEFTVGDFSRRVDLAVIKSSRLFAFEVKSDSDSLIRLEGQVSKYQEYFDKVIVVTAPRHTVRALELTPSNVGVWEISQGVITIKRKGRIKAVNSRKAFIEMMTAVELKKLSRSLQIPSPNVKRKTLERVLDNVAVSKLRNAAIDFIKGRYQSRNDSFFENLETGMSTPDALEHLKLPKKDFTSTDIDSFISALEELNQTFGSKNCSNKMVANA